MKSYPIYFLFYLLLAALSVSCQRESINEDFDQSLYECHQKTTWDKTSTELALLGKWAWKQTVCPRTASGKTIDKTSSAGTEILLEKNGKLTELRNGVKIREYSWSLDKKDGDLYGLTVTPYLEIVHGRILICQTLGQVDFGSSYVDGCDYRFKKVD